MTIPIQSPILLSVSMRKDIQGCQIHFIKIKGLVKVERDRIDLL